MPGKLFIVGTPIGNMEDITLRALRVLREADIIAAEDTRRTGQLLARHGIGKRTGEIVGREGPKDFAPAGSAIQPHEAAGNPAGAGHARPTIRDASSPSLVGLRCDAANADTQQRVPTSKHPRRLVSYHEFNEARRTQELLKELQQGRTVALVTDAGMPTISDPGQRLIQAVVEWNAQWREIPETPRGHSRPTTDNLEPNCRARTPEGFRAAENFIPIEIIPGPSAVTMAVAASGISGPYLFYGFLPHKSGQRRKALANLAPLPYTLVFFESPYRVVKSLRDMQELLGNRRAVVARELTKKFEEIIRGDLDAILKKLENRSIKGEITVVVEGPKE